MGRRRQLIRDRVEDALIRARVAGALSYEKLPEYTVERPREAAHGDYATNVAMLLAKPCRKAPRDIAKIIAEYIDFSDSPIEKMEIAGPGFINFRMKEDWLNQAACEMLAEGEDFGRSRLGEGQKIQVEFVSANPTGDLHMGNARGAAIGDSLASVLDMAGFEVEREYYINDAGNQIDKFARTLNSRYLTACGVDNEFPEDGYPGADLKELMEQLYSEIGDKYVHISEELRKEYLAEYGLKNKLASIKSSLERFGVTYDCWFSERSLHDSGQVKAAVEELDERGWLLTKDDAIWIDCSRMGPDMKPEVLVRGNGVPTYFAADIAYHKNKFQRGFDTVIDVWGADHHGHVARMQGSMEALGYRRDQLEVILMQFVRLIENGEVVKMSKRTGRFVTLDELIDDVGKDAARFLFIMRGADSLLDFDLNLAKEKSNDNPVYYVQYAHARICSILRAAAEQCVNADKTPDMMLLTAPAERDLLRKLADFPDEVAAAARLREPHRVAVYLTEVAAAFHNFYGQCHCLTDDPELTCARLHLIRMTAGVIRRGMNALGVSAPEKM
ncbi:MAG: arginine--tRNA ligase [Firmicutes bacterium]|nr:arginine--tRNA ligase [Bacillota bacterium]